MAPLDQWFLTVFSMNTSRDEVKIAWRRTYGHSILSKTWAMTAPPSSLLPDANLTLTETSARGYLNLVLLWEGILSDSEIMWIPAPSNMHYSQKQIIGGTAFDDSEDLLLSCSRNDTVIQTIDFASYGKPIGLFPNFQVNQQCHTPVALSVVENLCSGKQKCTVPANKWLYGDPCPKYMKWISVKARCSRPTTKKETHFSLVTPTTESSLLEHDLVQESISEIPNNDSQNGYRVKIGLDLDITARSQTQNRIDARLAVRQISLSLAVNLDRFVLIDLLYTNRTRTILTFTVLSGSTPSSLNDGLLIARELRAEIQEPDCELRDDPLLHTVPTTLMFFELECIPLTRCPSGEYVYKSESSCQSSTSPMSTLSTSTNLPAGIAVATIFGVGVVLFWRHCKSRNATPSRIIDQKQYFVNAGFEVFSGGSQELPSPRKEAPEFQLPGTRGKRDSLIVGMSNTLATPHGVANTLSDLESTFATINQ